MLINLRNALMTGRRLPYDAEIEFLESTGTQYIDTLVNADSNLSVEITMANAGSPWTNVNPTGVILATPRCRHHLNFDSTVYSNGVNYFFGNGDSCVVASGYRPADGEVFTFKVDAISKTFTLGSFLGTFPNNTFDTGLSYWLFGRNGTTPPYLGSLRIYSAKLWNGSILVRDLIPVRKGTVGYLYDRVSGKLFGNAGTGDFVLGPDVVPVEWLQSDAGSYINTGIIPDDTYGMEVTGYTTQTVDSAWIGTRNGSNQRCFMGYSPSLGFYYGWNGRQDIQYTTGVWSTASMNLYNSRKNMMDGTEVGSIAEILGAQNRAIYLFALTANGTLGLKLKSALITKGAEDVLKLQSVRVGTGSTWEGAMMDVLTRRIYRNAGTGAFAYGNDLKYPIPA